MQSFTTAWGLAVRRMLAYRGVSLAIAVGIVVASVVLAFIPAYERTMADLGVRFNLEQGAGSTPRAVAFAASVPVGTELAATEATTIDDVNRYAGWFLGYEATAIRSGNVTYSFDDADEGGRRTLEGYLVSASDLEDRVHLVDGDWPAPGEMGVVIGQPVADRSRMSVGDVLDVRQTVTNCLPPPPGGGGPDSPPPPPCDVLARLSQPLTVRVTGIVELNDPDDRFWSTTATRFDKPVVTDAGIIYPLAMPDEVARDLVARIAPGLSFSTFVVFRADTDAIDAGTVDDAELRLNAISDHLRTSEILFSTPISNAIRDYNRQSTFSGAPIRLLALQVGLVVIFYVVIVGSLLSDQMMAETALLRSRGAGALQVIALALLQGLTFAIPGVIIAPFLAGLAVSALGWSPTFADLATVDGPLPFVLPPASFIYAAGGALVAVIASTLPMVTSLRVQPAEERRRQARIETAPFFQRYYLDIGVLAVAAALIFELQQEDAAFDRNAFGGLSSDPLVLMAPTIFGLAAVAILLRVLPLLFGFAARVMRPPAGATGEVILTDLSRASGRFARLVALLVLVFALGTFAATFSPTLERSFVERTEYESGPGIRSEDLGKLNGSTTERVESTLGEVEGVDRIMATWRGDGALGIENTASRFPILAVDTIDVASFLRWRGDFAGGRDPGELFGGLATPVSLYGLAIPGEPESIRLEVFAPKRPNTNLWMRVADATGRAHLLDFGKLGPEGWVTREAALADVSTLGGDIQYPLTLLSIYMTEPTGFFSVADEPIRIDNIAAVEGGEVVPIESFESDQRPWRGFNVDPTLTDTIELVGADDAPDGERVLRLTVPQGRAPRKRGVFPASNLFPVRAVASQSFLNTHGQAVGNVVNVTIGNSIVPVSIEGAVDLMPTLDPGGRGFLVLDIDALFAWGEQIGEDPARPSGAWFDVAPGADPAIVADALVNDEGITVNAVRAVNVAETSENPILSAGASGLLWFGFVAAFVVLCLAVILSLALDAAHRRVSFAIIRALGFPSRAVFAVLAVEYGIIALLGAVAGILLGIQVSRTMIGFVDVTDRGREVIPPFVLVVEWNALGLSVLGLAVVVTIAVSAAAAYLVRASIARAIRLSA